MNWILSLIRVAGASFPIASSAVQLQAEIDARATQRRLRALEDPLTNLHPDIREISRQIYEAIRATGDRHVKFPEAFHVRYARALALLEDGSYRTRAGPHRRSS